MTESTVPSQGSGPGSTPRAPLPTLQVRTIPILIARRLLEREHYLHSLPGGTKLAFGAFVGNRLLGALTLGVGPLNAHSLVGGAAPDDCLTLTRFWMSDELPFNSESLVLGLVLKSLRRYTHLKFLLTYADPAQGHVGYIYQATNWLYTGLSAVMPLYDLGDGKARHSRSLSHAFGTHSVRHFAAHGVHPKWRPRLRVPVLPYPKKEK